ncbi:hypothetical protein [Streptomyces vastus]|uniref:Uncharacterized protein n=1 Tax=Streptomyces vastus TaxID=285451 RepID=A0ABP6CIS6_9ACTN
MNLTPSTTSRRWLKLLKAAALMTASVLVQILRFVLELVVVFAQTSRSRGSSSSSSGGDDG